MKRFCIVLALFLIVSLSGCSQIRGLFGNKEKIDEEDYTEELEEDWTIPFEEENEEDEILETLDYDFSKQRAALGDKYSMIIKDDRTLWVCGSNEFGQLGVNDLVVEQPFQILTNIISVSTGRGHSMALKDDGTLLAWGANNSNQVNSSQSTKVGRPEEIMRDVVYIEAGGDSSFAIKKDGSLWAWGDNRRSNLGISYEIKSTLTEPEKITDNIVKVSTSGMHTLLLSSDGEVFFMGLNDNGQSGSTNSSFIINEILSVATEAIDISTGTKCSFVVKEGGILFGAGSNRFGKVGNGRITLMDNEGFYITDEDVKQFVNISSNVKTVSAKYNHVAAVTTNGTLLTWGAEDNGRLGFVPTTGVSSLPRTVDITIEGYIMEVYVGSAHTYVFTSNDILNVGKGDSGELYRGKESSRTEFTSISTVDYIPEETTFPIIPEEIEETTTTSSELPTETTTSLELPIELPSEPIVTGDEKVIQVAAGSSHTLFLKSNNTVWASGLNNKGQLGIGTSGSDAKVFNSKIDSDKLVYVPLTDVIKVFAGKNTSFAILKDKSLYGWGINSKSELGVETPEHQSTPIKILDSVIDVAVGGSHTLVLQEDGELLVFGNNSYEQVGVIGDGKIQKTPIGVMSDIVKIAAGEFHSAAIDIYGDLYVWGHNLYGQLGLGHTDTVLSPTKVTGDVKDVVAGNYFTLILKNDGTLLACGFNYDGQLGNGTVNKTANPIFTPVTSNVTEIYAGVNHVVITKGNFVYSWGAGRLGQLGLNTLDNVIIPMDLYEGNVQSISLGENFTCVVNTDGDVLMCGDNKFGQYGNGTTINERILTKVN